jgi:hypothetical protein
VLVFGYIGITYVGYKAELPVLKQALDRAHLLQSGFSRSLTTKRCATSPDALLWSGWGSGSGPVHNNRLDGTHYCSRVSSVPGVQLYVAETVVEGEPCAFTARR